MLSYASDKRMAEPEILATQGMRIRTAIIHLRPDGILDILPDPGIDVTYEDAKEHIDAEIALAGDTKRPVLVRMDGVHSVSREARAEFSSERNAAVVNAVALLVKSPISRMIGNFFIGFNKAKYPTRLFTGEAEALTWLKTFVGKEKTEGR